MQVITYSVEENTAPLCKRSGNRSELCFQGQIHEYRFSQCKIASHMPLHQLPTAVIQPDPGPAIYRQALSDVFLARLFRPTIGSFAGLNKYHQQSSREKEADYCPHGLPFEGGGGVHE
jgi:hypothetical protein